MAAQRLRHNWTDPYTWDAAEDAHLSAEWANIHLRDMLGHIKRPPIVQLEMASGHGIQKDWTPVRWNKIGVDNWEQGNTRSDIVLPIRGHWHVLTMIGFDGGQDGARAVRILHNDVPIGEQTSHGTKDGGPLHGVSCAARATAGAGDSITIEAWSSAGSTQVSVKAKQPKSVCTIWWEAKPRLDKSDPSAPIRSLTNSIGVVSSAMGGKPIIPAHWLNLPVSST